MGSESSEGGTQEFDTGVFGVVEDAVWRWFRERGLSDDEVWAEVIGCVDDDWSDLGRWTERRQAAMVLYEIQDFYESVDSDDPQSPFDWAFRGFLIADLAEQLRRTSIPLNAFSEAQSRRGKRPRPGARSFAKLAVKELLRRLPADGRGFGEFRSRVSESASVRLGRSVVEITPMFHEYDEQERLPPEKYRFAMFDDDGVLVKQRDLMAVTVRGYVND